MINIIFGPPGTGKTWTLLDKLEEYIKQGVDINKIGFFTFSKNATKEVHDRMYKNCGFDKDSLPHFRTLHSLGFNQLGYSKEKVMKSEHYKEIGDACGIEMSYATWDDDHGGVFTSDSSYLSLIELARSKNISVEEQYNLGEHKDDLDRKVLERVAREINNFKKDRHMVDFNDMIIEFEKSKLCPKLKVAFIDEAQDLSVMQWKVVEKIKNNCEILFVAGDDDQCIYKWRGANVTCFLNLKGKREVLKKSYRVPKQIFKLAKKIINRIPKGNRVEKEWTPNSEEGFFRHYNGLDEIKSMSQGQWLILGADRWKLDAFETYLKENNIFYERAKKSNPIKDKYEAIDLYENRLKKGQLLSFEECHSIKKKMLKEQWDNKMFKALAKNKMYSMSDLREKYGLNTEEPWQVAFTRMGQSDTEKIDDLLKKGEDLKNGARIKLATIHGVKGNECDNVVLPLSLTATAQEAYEKNPDDTHRLMYVGSTRSKKTLHLIYPESKGGYEL